MNYERLRRRVERSEQLVEGRVLQTGTHLDRFKATWRESWTPTRIILAGLAAGFLVGRSDPGRALQRIGGLGGTRWIQLIGSLSGLFASLQSTVAAARAGEAAHHADDAAGQAGAAAASAHVAADEADAGVEAAGVEVEPEPRPRVDRRRPDPVWNTPPAPAEAATDVSER
jgi:hypothetical protein